MPSIFEIHPIYFFLHVHETCNSFVLEQLMTTVYNNDIQKIKEDVVNIKEDVANIKQEICNMKQELKLQTTKINLNLDKIYDLLSSKNNIAFNCENASRQNSVPIPAEDMLAKYKFPLSSTEDIYKLDEEIRTKSELKGQLVGILQIKLHYLNLKTYCFIGYSFIKNWRHQWRRRRVKNSL